MKKLNLDAFAAWTTGQWQVWGDILHDNWRPARLLNIVYKPQVERQLL
jgi:hypothetical protein